jgi:hypothetical protein
MATTRTTLTLDAAVWEQAQGRYRELGFGRPGELVSTALRDYLERRSLEDKLASMRRAAADPRYQRVLREISEDFAHVDGEGLPDPGLP